MSVNKLDFISNWSTTVSKDTARSERHPWLWREGENKSSEEQNLIMMVQWEINSESEARNGVQKGNVKGKSN